MRAVVVDAFGAPGLAPVREIPKPAAGPGEVLIRVEAVAANFVDILVLEGRYQFLPERPFTPGKGPAGVIDAVGEGVTRVRPGDRVLCMAESGGYAQFAIGPESQTYLLPDAMDFAEAASLSLAADTAWVALMERGRLAPGETVLVLGASGAVGAAALQIARAKGARTIAGVSSEAGRRRARQGLTRSSTSLLRIFASPCARR